MSKKLKIRTVKRNNLPFGKYNFILKIERKHKKADRARPNAGELVHLRQMLRDSGADFRMEYDTNFRGRRIYTTLYLVNPMDVAMVKLVHQSKLRKIYKVEVVNSTSGFADELDGVSEVEAKAENIV